MFRKAASCFFVITFTGILLLVFYGQSDVSWQSEKRQSADLPNSPESNKPLIIKMFTVTKVNEYGLDTILAADLLEVRPRRFMVFKAKSINEAALRNARIVLYTYEHLAPPEQYNEVTDALFDVSEYYCPPPCKGKKTDAARIEPLGRVTRLIADKIMIELFRDDEKILVIEAETGLVEKKEKGIAFFNATLEDVRSRRFIKARKIFWERKCNVFVIPGKYSDANPSGSVVGSAIQIDMDFVVTPLVRSNLLAAQTSPADC